MCLFSSIFSKTTVGPATAAVVTCPAAGEMTCTLACTANSHINQSISMHSLYHPSFSQDSLHGRKKNIQLILLAENLN